jgi:hypothetical protein
LFTNDEAYLKNRTRLIPTKEKESKQVHKANSINEKKDENPAVPAHSIPKDNTKDNSKDNSKDSIPK